MTHYSLLSVPVFIATVLVVHNTVFFFHLRIKHIHNTASIIQCAGVLNAASQSQLFVCLFVSGYPRAVHWVSMTTVHSKHACHSVRTSQKIPYTCTLRKLPKHMLQSGLTMRIFQYRMCNTPALETSHPQLFLAHAGGWLPPDSTVTIVTWMPLPHSFTCTQKSPQSLRLFLMITSVTASNTNCTLFVSVAQVKCV